MAKQTLIEIVTDILNDMDGDYVTSINDTEESQQVAQIVKSTYQALMSNRNWPHTKRLIQLTPFSDDTLPTHMKMQDDIKEMVSINYFNEDNDTPRFTEIKWKEPDDFLRLSNNRSLDDRLAVTDPTGVLVYVGTKYSPSYFTTFNDDTLIFDSYNADVDDSLQSSKIQAVAYVIPSFELEDDFVPDLPLEAFTLLIEEAKSKAMFHLKQMADTKAEQESGRQNRWLSRKSWRAKGGILYPNYGRKGRGRQRYPTFEYGRK